MPVAKPEADLSFTLATRHELHGLRRTVDRREVAVDCLGGVEGVAPRSLEVDRVDQEHHVLGRDTVENLGYPAVGLVADPAVDLGDRALVERRRLDLGIEVRAQEIQKALVKGNCVAMPDGIRDLKRSARVEPGLQLEEAAIASIDLRQIPGAEAE